MKKLIIIFSSALLCISSAVYSQQYRTGYDRHEFSVGVGGGLSGLNFNPAGGINGASQSNGFGGSFGLGYHYFFSPYWAIGTGVDLALYNGKYKMNSVTHKYMTADYKGDMFELTSVATNFSENHKAMMLQIPLMVQYQTGSIFYAAAGGKLALPINAKYDGSGAFKNTGYFEHENKTYGLEEIDKWMGLWEYPGNKIDGDLDLKMAFLASLEAGVKLKLKNSLSLYIGAYFDYGLNNVVKSNNARFVDYKANDVNLSQGNWGGDFSANSVVNSQYLNGAAKNSFTNKVSPMASGIKVRLTLGSDGFISRRDPGERYTAPPRQTDAQRLTDEEAARRTEYDAAQRAAEEAARRAAEEARLAAEEARRADEEARRLARNVIEKPTDGYEVNESILEQRQLRELDEKIVLLNRYQNIRFYINGHTCDIGSDEVNERVGMQRAERARAYLISQGISSTRILTLTSKRDTEPLVPNTSEDNRKINRRVQLLIAD